MSTSTQRIAIAARLRAVRIALGWDRPRGRNQVAFYRSFDIGTTRGNNWEKGVAHPDVDFLIRLDTAFGIDPGWILCGHHRGLPEDIRDVAVEHFNKLTRKPRGKKNRSEMCSAHTIHSLTE